MGEQNAALETLKREQDNARKQASAALAAAERGGLNERLTRWRRPRQHRRKKLCELIEVKLNTFIEERQKESAGSVK